VDPRDKGKAPGFEVSPVDSVRFKFRRRNDQTIGYSVVMVVKIGSVAKASINMLTDEDGKITAFSTNRRTDKETGRVVSELTNVSTGGWAGTKGGDRDEFLDLIQTHVSTVFSDKSIRTIDLTERADTTAEPEVTGEEPTAEETAEAAAAIEGA